MSVARRAGAALAGGAAVLVALAVGGALLSERAARGPAFDPGEPPGRGTGARLTALTGDAAACRALLDQAGVRYTRAAPVRAEGGACGYADGVRLAPGGALGQALAPAGEAMACPVALSLAMWDWHVVQPAALRHLGSEVVRVEQLGSYNCRRIAGSGAAWSEHATADAIDVAGFVLADGRRVTVAEDWQGNGAAAAFLRDVRDGACGLFATVLSPEYNAAHRDHLHFDHAVRGMGWRACR